MTMNTDPSKGIEEAIGLFQFADLARSEQLARSAASRFNDGVGELVLSALEAKGLTMSDIEELLENDPDSIISLVPEAFQQVSDYADRLDPKAKAVMGAYAVRNQS